MTDQLGGGLFAAQLPEARPVRVWAKLYGDAGGFSLLLRMAAPDLAQLIGAPEDSDLARLTRHAEASAGAAQGGLAVSVGLTRPKTGLPLARPVTPGSGDWVLGPIPFTPPDHRKALLAACVQQGLLPLTWRDVAAHLARGSLLLPDLLGLRALVGESDAILAPGATAPARRRAARSSGIILSEATSLTLPLGPPPPRRGKLEVHPGGATEQAGPAHRGARGDSTADPGADPGATPRPGPRRRGASVRISAGKDGRIGLTIAPEAMDALWAGRAGGEERVCLIGGSDSGLVLLPEGDGLAAHLPTVAVRLRRDGPNWYGRTALKGEHNAFLRPVVERCGPGRGGALASGRGLLADMQPGRILLSLAQSPAAPAARADGASPPAPDRRTVDKLARARQLMTEAFGLVRAARGDAGQFGTPVIEITDTRGTALLALPTDAAGARIRVEIG